VWRRANQSFRVDWTVVKPAGQLEAQHGSLRGGRAKLEMHLPTSEKVGRELEANTCRKEGRWRRPRTTHVLHLAWPGLSACCEADRRRGRMRMHAH